MIEIILLVLILIAAIFLIRVNFFSACVLALVLSTFIHKELFSIYIWDMLPIRVLMGAFILSSIYDFYKFNGFSLKFVKYLKDPLVILLLLFLVSKFISTFNSLDVRTSIFMNIFYLAIVNFVITIYFKLKEDELISLFKKYILIAFVLSLIPFIQIYLYFNNNYLFGAILNVAGLNVDFPSFKFSAEFFTQALKLIVMTRLGSIFWDVNHFGGFLAGLFVPALALVTITKSKEQRNFFIYFLTISIGLFLTNSRSAWIIGFVALLVFSILVVYRKIGKKGVVYSIFGFIFTFVILFSMYQDRDSLLREKVRSYFHYRMDSFDSHFLLLQGAVDVFNKYPLLGGGTGSFFEHFKETPTSNEFLKRDPAGLSGRVPAHSIWGEVISESGVIGLIVFSALSCLLIFIYIYAINHSKDWRSYFLYSSFLGTLLGYLIAGIFYSYNSEFFFIILFFPALYVLKKEKIVFEELFLYFKAKNIYLKFSIFAIAASLLLFGLGDNKLITYDEAIYAKVAKNIYESGDYFTLTWSKPTNLWFEKPPLYFIVTAYFYSVLDVTEFSTRLASVIFSLLGLIFTYKLAKILFNSSYIGIFAVFGLILNISYLYYSRIGMLDVTLTSFIVASIYYFIKFESSLKKLDLVLSGLFIGLAVMTKSLIGFLPLVIIGIYFLVSRFIIKNKTYSFFDVFIIGIVSLLISAPWHIHMYQVHGQQFIDTYFGYHQFGRYSTSAEAKQAPWDFYITVIRNTMRIWFILLIPAVVLFVYNLYKKEIPKNNWILLLSAAVIFLLFSTSTSKLKWYIMPVYPFLYIICGYFVFFIFNNLVKKKLNLNLVALSLFIFIFVNLGYLYTIRDMVYTYDFNSRSVDIITANNTLPGIQKTYIDKVDYPIALFYNLKTDADFVQFSSLKDIVPDRVGDQTTISIITSPNRFEKLKNVTPALLLITQNQDFVLGTLNYQPKN